MAADFYPGAGPTHTSAIRYPAEVATTARRIEDLERQAGIIMRIFARAGFEPVSPPVIQPADLLFDLVGEDLRGRTYVFTDPEGAELCLRNELTIPTCRLYAARHGTDAVPARYAYNGLVFRWQATGGSSARPREFGQIGIESFASPDGARAEAEVLALMSESVRAAGIRAPRIQIGDLGLFRALLEAIEMPDRWRQRLHHHFWTPRSFHRQIGELVEPTAFDGGLPVGLLHTIATRPPEAAAAIVERHLELAGLAVTGTRTVEEIAELAAGHADDRGSRPLPRSAADLIEAYLAIRAPAPEATRRIRALLEPAGIDIGPALQAFDDRLALIAEEGIEPAQLSFSAGFGRTFEYYTGFVFEVSAAVLGDSLPLGGGGRYDTLVSAISGGAAVPAVGAALHSERLLLAAQGRRDEETVAAPPVSSARRVTERLVLAIPSKGRLMEDTTALLGRAGFTVERIGDARGYRGELLGLDGVEIAFVSASEIAKLLKSGEVHLGVTGEDLVRETIPDAEETFELVAKLGFGHADVVAAVPDFWIDVDTMADLEEACALYRRRHGKRMRVATKYTNITRRFFGGHRYGAPDVPEAVTIYRLVESLGATEGAPAAGTAELIVDITSTGSTLKANGLKILADGVMLRSEANLVASNVARWSPAQSEARAALVERLRKVLGGA